MKINLGPSNPAMDGAPRNGVLNKMFTLTMLAALTVGCGGGGSSSSGGGGTASPEPVEEITSKTLEATEVTATVRVPSATTTKTLADNGISFGIDDFLYALKGLVPEALALEEADFRQVSGSDIDILNIDLLRFTQGSGYSLIAITDEQKSNAFAKDTVGNLSIDLAALNAAGVDIDTALDTSLVLQVKIIVEIDGQPDVEITMRSPLVDEALDVSPVSEFVVRVIGKDAEADLSNLNITEVRKLLSDAFEVSVAGSGSVQNPDDLVTGLEQTGGAQIEEQFEGYQQEEPVDETITAANGTFNLLIFEQSLIAATPNAGFSFGEEFHLAERASITLNLDSGGNGTARFNGDAPTHIGGEAELNFDNDGFTSLEAESFSGAESDEGSAELHGNGNILLTFPGGKEFDSEFTTWNVSDPFKLTLRRMGLAASGQGRIGVGFGVENEFGDAGGAPNFNDHLIHGNFTPLVVALPQSSVGAGDFTRDMGVVFIDSVMESLSDTSFRFGYEVGDELIAVTATPGVFSGGNTAFFEIERTGAGTTFDSSPSDPNSDTLTFGNFSNGTFDITSTPQAGPEESSGFGIAVPGGDLMAAIAMEVDCRDDNTQTVRTAFGTLNCNVGETATAADTTLFVGVPVADAPSLQQGDQYRFVIYELDTEGGVESCRGDLTVDAVAPTQDLTLSNQKCTVVDRVGAPDTSVSAITTFSPADETLAFNFNARALEQVDNAAIRGFVSDDQNTIVLRYADPTDPNFVGVLIASRVVNSAP